MKTYLSTLAILFTFIASAQSVYMHDFGTSFGGWGFWTNYSGGVVDNGGTTIRSCTYTNGADITGGNIAQYSKSNIYDANAGNYGYNWDSLVFKFRYRTDGYATNFRIFFDYLTGTGPSYDYDVQSSFTQPDSQDVKVVVGGPAVNPVNCAIGLVKYDTTLNNFTVYLSNLSIKGYINYNAAGLSEYASPQSPIGYNSEMLFFPEKWLNKKYTITDLMGKEYTSGTVNSSNERHNLQDGMYIIRTENFVQKILIVH